MIRVPKVDLTGTELKVSKLGFGTYDFGVPSLDVSAEEGGRILIRAYELGINYWDTSDDYGSHPHVASALKSLPREDVVISTKTYARDGSEAEKSLNISLEELDTDYVDIFLLHFVGSDWIDDCRRVLKALKNMKTTGAVKAAGLSTHSVKVVRKASEFEEVDVIMTICCRADQAVIDKYPQLIPLEDGSLGDMLDAIKQAHDNGKGVIAMKVLGNAAPPLVSSYRASMRAVTGMDFVDTLVIGMKNLNEVDMNVKALTED